MSAAQKQPEKAKRKKLSKQSDPLPAKRLRVDHPSLLPDSWEDTDGIDAFLSTLVDRVRSPRLFLHTPKYGIMSRTEHELKLKEKLRAKYDARGVLLREKDAGIARLKSLVKEKETESAEVLRLRDQVSVLAADKSFLSTDVSALKSVVSQKDTDISLLDSRASYLKSALDDSQAACDEARNLISSLSSERYGLSSEVSTLHSAFRDFKEKMEAQQETQAQIMVADARDGTCYGLRFEVPRHSEEIFPGRMSQRGCN
ncbi:hypothetical protein Tco_0652768 [Tanacetum coccineum]|uniref:Uncharacterized protein n=1 Tax=Tanacetum coccineum TaxID=301880 RepID=A0ABQ4WYJ5_9ASTR